MTPEIDKLESDRRELLKDDELLQLYRIADENHRFYVDKRFKIISLYFPAMTLVLSGLYYLSYQANIWYLRFILSAVAIALILFLYALEMRNWTLSNICSDRCVHLGNQIEAEEDLHVQLNDSYKVLLPYSTGLDRLIYKLVKKPTQHKAVCYLSIFLVLVWTTLILISVPGVLDWLMLLPSRIVSLLKK